jgi:hypothetical protein
VGKGKTFLHIVRNLLVWFWKRRGHFASRTEVCRILGQSSIKPLSWNFPRKSGMNWTLNHECSTDMYPLHCCLIQRSWLLNDWVSHVETETTELCSYQIIRSKSTVLSVKPHAFLAFGNTEMVDQALSVAWDKNKFLFCVKSEASVLNLAL